MPKDQAQPRPDSLTGPQLPDQTDPLLTLAGRALQRYGMGGAEVRLIRHNENAAFAVRTPAGRRYLLRIHSPVSANLLGIQHTFEGLNAEMLILQAVRKGTGIPLQQPVANDAGFNVTGVEDDRGDSAAGPRTVPCTLLTWIDGDALTGKDPRLDCLVPRMAAVAARLHRFARAWLPAVPLPRPVYDLAKYQYLADHVARGVSLGLFSEERYAIVTETMHHIAELFACHPRTPASWGLIHADLGPGNWVLAEDGELVPIDWCFSGHGPYLFDVGGTVPGLRPELRRAFIAGYQAEQGALSAAELRFSDACFILSVVGAVGFHISNPTAHEWIARRMPWFTDRYCRLFLAGESPLRADE